MREQRPATLLVGEILLYVMQSSQHSGKVHKDSKYTNVIAIVHLCFIVLKVIVVVKLGAHFVFLFLATIASFDRCLIVVCDIRTYPLTGGSCQYKLVGTSLISRHFCSSFRCYHY